MEESPDKDVENVTLEKNKVKKDTIELVANKIYDKITMLFNERRKRLGIKGGANIEEPTANYNSFDLDDNGNLTFVRNNEDIYIGNINERRLNSPSRMIKTLGVNRLKLMGFSNITDEDICPYRARYKEARKKVRKLNENLDERSKEIKSSSTTDAEAIELMEITSKDIDTTIKVVEQDMPFIEPGQRDKLLPLRELERLDKQLRTIKGSLKVAVAKRVDLKAHTEHKERKLSEVQKPTYSDDQITMIEDRIKELRDELNQRDEEIDILKGEASNQINQIRESITKFLDKETGTLGETIRTLFKERGITIVSILTAVGLAVGVLIEALYGCPRVSINKSGNNSGGDKKGGGGAGEWVKKQLKAVSWL